VFIQYQLIFGLSCSFEKIVYSISLLLELNRDEISMQCKSFFKLYKMHMDQSWNTSYAIFWKKIILGCSN